MKPTPTREPRTLREFLDREEARTLHELGQSAAAFGQELKQVGQLEARVQRHPWLAIGAAAAIGFGAGPLVGRASGRVGSSALRLLRTQPWLGSALKSFALHLTQASPRTSHGDE